jgi:hypothetical protein
MVETQQEHVNVEEEEEEEDECVDVWHDWSYREED